MLELAEREWWIWLVVRFIRGNRSGIGVIRTWGGRSFLFGLVSGQRKIEELAAKSIPGSQRGTWKETWRKGCGKKLLSGRCEEPWIGSGPGG